MKNRPRSFCSWFCEQPPRRRRGWARSWAWVLPHSWHRGPGKFVNSLAENKKVSMEKMNKFNIYKYILLGRPCLLRLGENQATCFPLFVVGLLSLLLATKRWESLFKATYDLCLTSLDLLQRWRRHAIFLLTVSLYHDLGKLENFLPDAIPQRSLQVLVLCILSAPPL